MDHRRFDSLTQALATAQTRRGVLAGLAGLGVLLLGWRAATATLACPIPGQTLNRKGECNCPPGTDACSNGCFAKKRDLNNCGTCGNICLAGEECRKGEGRCPRGATCGVPTTTTTTTAAATFPPAVCTMGTDAESGSPWVVCRADADTAWISHNDPVNGGTYQPSAICQELGYAGYDLLGTCSRSSPPTPSAPPWRAPPSGPPSGHRRGPAERRGPCPPCRPSLSPARKPSGRHRPSGRSRPRLHALAWLCSPSAGGIAPVGRRS